ncbi:MAG: oxygen-dependent coproporphyrinogen oxidase [Caedimonadaceae bacterium]|nr:MAG: oxygen-dependent coproporphyrinogen oxidase [Caedimonadaceae bacterium]
MSSFSIEQRKEKASDWFRALQLEICNSFEMIEKDYAASNNLTEPTSTFTFNEWSHPQNGGGISGVMVGNVFEKVGVNFSKVFGEFSDEFKKEIPGAHEDPSFWASGISLVAHMKSPLVPAVHMNTRYIVTNKDWFGGGADLTPYFPVDEDTNAFHRAFQEACDQHSPLSYAKYKKWCDEYFYLKHRNEPRGVGGIFYDYLEGDWDHNFAFTQNVGRAFARVYPEIVRRNMLGVWTQEQREYQLERRGRYVEFNLLYDRGTQFGLKTGGNVEAILMSMPPQVKWA